MRISNCPNEPKDNTELIPNALYVPHTPRPEDHGKFIDHISNTFSMEIFVFRFHIIVNDVMDNDLALVGWQIVTWTNVEYISDWTWRHLVTLTESTVKYARKCYIDTVYFFVFSSTPQNRVFYGKPWKSISVWPSLPVYSFVWIHHHSKDMWAA